MSTPTACIVCSSSGPSAISEPQALCLLCLSEWSKSAACQRDSGSTTRSHLWDWVRLKRLEIQNSSKPPVQTAR